MNILDIKEAIRAELKALSEAAIQLDYLTASKHFDNIMMLTGKLGDFHNDE